MSHDECRCDLLDGNDTINLPNGWRIGTAIRSDGTTSVWLVNPHVRREHTHEPAPRTECGRPTATGRPCRITTRRGTACHHHRTANETAFGRAADRFKHTE